MNLPFDWLCLDLETVAGRPESAEDWVRRHWWPDARWSPEVKGKRLDEMLAKKREKLALLDAAGIACVAVQGGRGDQTEGGPGVVHAFGGTNPLTPALSPDGGEGVTRDYADVKGFADEKDMLLFLRGHLDTMTGPDTQLVGFNIKGFDLPRLRFAYLRNRLRLPKILAEPGVRVCDLMVEFCRRFSVDRVEYISLRDVNTKLGRASHKDVMDGSMVGELLAAGKFEDVWKYAALDVLDETGLYLWMSGKGGELQ